MRLSKEHLSVAPERRLRDHLTGIEWDEGSPVPQGVLVARCMVSGAFLAFGCGVTGALAALAWHLGAG